VVQRIGFADLLHQKRIVLFFFGLELEKPGVNFRKNLDFLRIYKYPKTISLVLVIETESIAPEIEDPEPAVSRRAGGQQLDGVRKAAEPRILSVVAVNIP